MGGPSWRQGRGGDSREGEGSESPLMLKRMGWEEAGLCFSRRRSDSSGSFLSRSLVPRMA